MKLYKSVRFAGLFCSPWALAAPGVSSAWQQPQREQKDGRPQEEKPLTKEEAAKLKELEQRACGPKQARYLVRVDAKQHPTPEAPPDKALVYVVGPELEGHPEETKLSIDGQWVGANRANMYFFFEVEPGQHSFCSDVKGHHSVLTLTVKPGSTYYLEQSASSLLTDRFAKSYLGFSELTGKGAKVAMLDEQEGKNRLTKSHLSISIEMEEAKLKGLEQRTCGPKNTQHLVLEDTKQHPTPEAPPDKALVYVVRPSHTVDVQTTTTFSVPVGGPRLGPGGTNQTMQTSSITSRASTSSEGPQLKLAVDGQWVGANNGDSYFFFVTEPGEHYFCSHSRFGNLLLALTVEPGRTYYLRHNVGLGAQGFKISLLNEQEG